VFDMEKKDTHHVHAQIDKKLVEDFKELSAFSNMSMTEVITKAIEKHNKQVREVLKENEQIKNLFKNKIEI
jgi:hypothetical protein